MLDPAGGRQLPFVHVYNEVHGIHLVILSAQHGALKFPVGYRVYRGKGTPTPVPLARDLLRTVPDTVRTRFRVHVLADSGSPAAAFLDEVRKLGFEFVVGVRSTRRTEPPGVVTVADRPHGGYVELRNWPHDTLPLGRVQRGQRVFQVDGGRRGELREGEALADRVLLQRKQPSVRAEPLRGATPESIPQCNTACLESVQQEHMTEAELQVAERFYFLPEQYDAPTNFGASHLPGGSPLWF